MHCTSDTRNRSSWCSSAPSWHRRHGYSFPQHGAWGGKDTAWTGARIGAPPPPRHGPAHPPAAGSPAGSARIPARIPAPVPPVPPPWPWPPPPGPAPGFPLPHSRFRRIGSFAATSAPSRLGASCCPSGWSRVPVGGELWRSPSPSSLPRQGHPEQVTQERVQVCWECLQKGTFHDKSQNHRMYRVGRDP